MMSYNFIIEEKRNELKDTYIFRVIPTKKNIPEFYPGQYCYITNPTYIDPSERHPFSIASSPKNTNYLEFCVKTYGTWTQAFSKKGKGEIVSISDPQGTFFWEPKIPHAVFLLGGIGIAPIMSMLRFISQSDKKPTSITLLYGNRTPDTIAYKDELEKLTSLLPLKLVHIFSHIPDTHPWKGYRGFITKDIIQQEIALQVNPTFLSVGPPIFIEKMKRALSELHVPADNIKEELLEEQAHVL